MKAAFTLHHLPLLEYQSAFTQETSLSFKNFLATWSIIEINTKAHLKKKKRRERLRKTCKMSRKTMPFSTYRQRQGLYNVHNHFAFCTGQIQRVISVKVHTIYHAFIWRCPFMEQQQTHDFVTSRDTIWQSWRGCRDKYHTHTHTPRPPRVFSLELGKRDLIHWEKNEGQSEKCKRVQKKEGLFWRCVCVLVGRTETFFKSEVASHRALKTGNNLTWR